MRPVGLGEQLLMDDADEIDDDEGVEVAEQVQVAVDDDGGDVDGQIEAAEVEVNIAEEEEEEFGNMMEEDGPTNDLGERAVPEVPLPLIGPCQDPDPDGWASIERVGGWNALLTEFITMEEVPHQHRQAWTWAWGEVLDRVQIAQEGRQLDRALMWLCFLPHSHLFQGDHG